MKVYGSFELISKVDRLNIISYVVMLGHRMFLVFLSRKNNIPCVSVAVSSPEYINRFRSGSGITLTPMM